MSPILPRLRVCAGDTLTGAHIVARDWPVGRILFTEKTCGDGIHMEAGATVIGCVVAGFGGVGFRVCGPGVSEEAINSGQYWPPRRLQSSDPARREVATGDMVTDQKTEQEQ